jgi:hypothetical protein
MYVLIEAALLTLGLPVHQGFRASGHQQLLGMKICILMRIRRKMVALN